MSTNRLSDENGWNGRKLTQEELASINDAVALLYNLIPVGATMRVDVLRKPKVITKDYESRAIINTLLITKPAALPALSLQVTT